MFRLFLLTLILSILPNLACAQQSLDNPFILKAQNGFNVVLKNSDYGVRRLFITRSEIRLPRFNLTNGALSTPDGRLVASYDPVPPIYPPPLFSISFADKILLRAKFVAKIRTVDKKKILVLTEELQRTYRNQPIRIYRLTSTLSFRGRKTCRRSRNIYQTQRQCWWGLSFECNIFFDFWLSQFLENTVELTLQIVQIT